MAEHDPPLPGSPEPRWSARRAGMNINEQKVLYGFLTVVQIRAASLIAGHRTDM